MKSLDIRISCHIFEQITTPSCPIEHNTKQSLLDVRFNIKNMLHGFFWLHISLRMKGKILAPQNLLFDGRSHKKQFNNNYIIIILQIDYGG
jgi:hypothetical protein